MGSLTTANVGLNMQCLAPGPVAGATADQVLIINLDAKNTVNLGSASTNLSFPLGPLSSITLSAPVYAAAATQPLVVGIAPGGTSFFQPASLANIGGSKVYVQGTTPTGSIPANSIWFNTSTSALETWDGTGWVTRQFSAQELIQDSTILAAQIADGTLTAAQLAAAAGILGGQIASATITSGNIAANTIVAANIAANTITAAEIAANTITAGQIAAATITATQIAANTITAGLLAAGIVVAGIVDATTVSAATFTGSTFEGTDFVIDTAGAFFYSGTPAAGNLVFSIASTAGTDGFGNAYNAGIIAYGPNGSGVALVSSGGTPIAIFEPQSAAHLTYAPQILASITSAGAANEAEDLVLTSGKAGHDDAAIQLFSEAADASSAARAVIEFGGSVAVQVDKTNTTFTTGAGTGFSGTPALVQVDNTDDTNANNGTQPCTEQWPIPANDAQAGTVYEVETPYNGTFETSSIGFKPRLNGSGVTTSGGDTTGPSFFPTAGTSFAGNVRVRMIVRTTGASGTADFFVEGGIGINGNRSSGSNNNNGYLSSQATTVALDTTVANTLGINSVWGASVASQTVVCHGSVFTRKGP